MQHPDRTLPVSLYLSVAIVAVTYIAVTIGAQMLASDRLIVSRKEVAFVAVGRAALGQPGRWIAIVGAILATGSAINATLFSTARLVRDGSRTGDLPRILERENHGLPIIALVFISVVGAGMAMFPHITSVIAFGSAAFLAVYAVVNYLRAQTAPQRRDRIVAWIGGAACVAALIVLFVELARDDLQGLIVLIGLTIAVGFGRVLFVRRARTAPQPRP